MEATGRKLDFLEVPVDPSYFRIVDNVYPTGYTEEEGSRGTLSVSNAAGLKPRV